MQISRSFLASHDNPLVPMQDLQAELASKPRRRSEVGLCPSVYLQRKERICTQSNSHPALYHMIVHKSLCFEHERGEIQGGFSDVPRLL